MEEELQELEMRFDPQTIKHLGLRMYSTLPPALAELISNSYDADASIVEIKLIEKNGTPQSIVVWDDGDGMSYQEINNKFLVIGRNRRDDGDGDGDVPSKKYNRRPTGKKGLGKLALFGLANTIEINTVKDGIQNIFILDWASLMTAQGTYKPKIEVRNKKTLDKNGTTITMKNLKRVTPFDACSLADSLSRIFIFDDNFQLVIKPPVGDKISIDNMRKYETINEEFRWDVGLEPYTPLGSDYTDKIKGILITAEKPLSPQSGLRGVTLYSRGKLVNLPEFFSNSASSHFYQYLTGWISIDFIDELDDDVISTNRQSIDWDNPEMAKLRKFLSGIISQINIDWRKKRKEKKTESLNNATGINTEEWLNTLPGDVKTNTRQIIEALGGEDAIETFTPVIKSLHALIPEYPFYHWRHLHKTVREESEKFYVNKDYYTAFFEAVKKYISEVENKSGCHESSPKSMMGRVFADKNHILSVIGNYKKQDGRDFSSETIRNIQEGQQLLSQGIVVGGRNPFAHEVNNELKGSDLFSESDCLDLLSLLSHLFKRLDNSKKVAP